MATIILCCSVVFGNSKLATYDHDTTYTNVCLLVEAKASRLSVHQEHPDNCLVWLHDCQRSRQTHLCSKLPFR